MHMYEKLFSEYEKQLPKYSLQKMIWQIERGLLNARNAFLTLFEQNVIPIVNENDAVVVDEIKFGDNDTLSAMVSSLIDSDMLIILSDIDGLYTANPKTDSSARLIHEVSELSSEIKASAGDAGSKLGTGGMITKIKAAEIAVSSGCAMMIVNGTEPNVIYKALDGEQIGTFFYPTIKPLQSRKSWIAYNTHVKGSVVIDEGAIKAVMKKGKSLLLLE